MANHFARKFVRPVLVASLVLFVATAGLAVQNNNSRVADAATVKVLDTEEAWKLEKQLLWDPDLRIVYFHIRSNIRLDNVTEGLIQGSITDLNGTILNIYGKESIILARFGYDSGARSDWQIVTKPSNGHFSFDIPSRYSDADYVKLWVNPNNFVIQPGPNDSEEQSYHQPGTEIAVNDDGIYVMSGAPPLPFVNVASDEGLDMQEFPVYQGQISAKVASAMTMYSLRK